MVAKLKEKIVRAAFADPVPPPGPDPRFLRGISPELSAALAASAEVVFDFETTCLTPWSVEEKKKDGKIGTQTVAQYCREFHTELSSKPRARILSIGTTGGVFVVDLDALSAAEQKELVLLSLDGKIVVGHNVQFDLVWATHICPDVHPARIVDTMILLRAFYPQGEVMLRKRVASRGFARDADLNAAAQLIIQADCGSGKNSSFGSLLAACLLVGLPAPDKAYQMPVNWMPGVLSGGHYDYCAADATEPAAIARRIVAMAACATGDERFSHPEALRGGYDGMSTERLVQLIDSLPGARAYRVVEKAIPVLVQMQKNGLKIDAVRAGPYIEELRVEVERIFDKALADIPALSGLRAQVLTRGETQELKHALDRAVGGVLPRTASGLPSLAANALALAGLDAHPVLSNYSKIKEVLKRAAMVEDYLAMADIDSRIHPSVTVLAATLRTTSQNPNLQNVPRDKRVRALYRAAPGNKMLAIDYSAVELRIAAALAARCYEQVRQMIESGEWGHMRWLSDAIIERLQGNLPEAADPVALQDTDEEPVSAAVSINRWRDYYADLFAKQLKLVLATGPTMMMRKAFTEKVDPHLATALYLLSLSGEFDLQGKNPIDFLSSASLEEQKALKEKYKSNRQSAKACNFGLLYGMGQETLHSYGVTGYGLSWSVSDAASAYRAWHDLYPELGLWQLYTRLAGRFVDPMGNKKHDLGGYRQDHMEVSGNRKVYQAHTLSGRPVVSARSTEALNFQDQGSGAEIALSALGALPEEIQKRLVLFVHDELVFEVPAEEAEGIKAEVERVMLDAADKLLEPWGVPCEAEGAISDSWQH